MRVASGPPACSVRKGKLGADSRPQRSPGGKARGWGSLLREHSLGGCGQTVGRGTLRHCQAQSPASACPVWVGGGAGERGLGVRAGPVEDPLLLSVWQGGCLFAVGGPPSLSAWVKRVGYGRAGGLAPGAPEALPFHSMGILRAPKERWGLGLAGEGGFQVGS